MLTSEAGGHTFGVMSGDETLQGKRQFPEIVLTLVGASSILYLVPSLILINMAGQFGTGSRVAVGLLCLALFLFLLKYLGRFMTEVSARRRDEARRLYKSIYRVNALPGAGRGVCLDRLKAGDYGWECRPWINDGLLYLQGLNEQWGVVWIAGFRPEEVEFVCEKPFSQYDWASLEYAGSRPRAPYHWGSAKCLTGCPFAVATPAGKQNQPVRLSYPV
jgi:hypothetical protein